MVIAQIIFDLKILSVTVELTLLFHIQEVQGSNSLPGDWLS
jgi:hypothetical protein